MGIIAGIILIGVLIYTVIALNRQKNKAEADSKRKNLRGKEKTNSQEYPNHDDSEEKDDASGLKK